MADQKVEEKPKQVVEESSDEESSEVRNFLWFFCADRLIRAASVK